MKLLLNYSVWREYSDKLVISDFPKELQPVYSSLNGFHAANEQQMNLTVPDLANLVLAHTHKDKEYYLELLSNLDKLDVAEETTSVLINSILDNKKLKEISLAAYDVTEGRMSRDKIVSLFQDFLSVSEDNKQDEFEFVTTNLEELANHTIKSRGLRWRLKTLNEMLGSLRKGDFGFVFARPETGKTTFLASEVMFMLENLPDDAGPILWVNNEEQGEKVMLRCYQAFFGIPLAQLLSDISGYGKEFEKQTRGKFKLIDRAIVHKGFVERVCKSLSPSLIIFDQLDKIVGFDDDREDLRLGAIYQWARELAKQHAPVIAVCQADGTGEGVKWLTMSNVANAKTAKQAEADFILGIGKIPDPGYDALRYLHLSKNKLMGDEDTIPDQRHARRECLIDPVCARYRDLT